MVVSTCQLHLYQEIYRSSRQLPFFGWCWSECDVTYGILTMAAIVCWQSEADCAESKSEANVWNTPKLSCAAQQEGIVHFYAVTDIKGLSCPLWWMREWRNLLTSTHVGYRSVIRAVASGVSLKFGVQGASATNWLSRVNGARDNGIRQYSPETPNLGQIRRFLEAATLKFDGWPWKTIGHLFYATSSFVHHFVAIGEFKLQLQSGNAQSGSNSTIFRGVRPWNLTDDLAKQ